MLCKIPNLSCDLWREGVGWGNAIGMRLDLPAAVVLAGTMSIPGPDFNSGSR